MVRIETKFAVSVLLLFGSATLARAQQQMPEFVPLGSVRVESCAPATDPEYGLVKEKAIQIGGGPMYMNARQGRYLDALRGPQGQPLRRGGGVGSIPLNPPNATTIIDVYTVTYEGHDEPIQLYLDAYHFDHPKVPRGFTCAAPLPTVLGAPPADPFKATPNTAALAVQQAARSFAPIPLDADGSPTHGVAFDQFRMIALAARMAAAAGTAFNPENPPASARSGIVVLAYPLSCEGRAISAQHVEIVNGQNPLLTQTALLSDKAEIEKLLPGIDVPASSVAARFGLAFWRAMDQVRITYAETCGSSAVVTLPLRFEPARLVASAPAITPAGVLERASALYVQAVIGMDGMFERPIVLGGPAALEGPALDAIKQWRAQPIRVNGTPMVGPIVVQIEVR